MTASVTSSLHDREHSTSTNVSNPLCEHACNDGRQIVILRNDGRQIVILRNDAPEPICPDCGMGPRAQPIRIICVPCDYGEVRS